MIKDKLKGYPKSLGLRRKILLSQERNRIALDLHDCCAQDLANIIKRLELCEKLFKIEPAKGFEELKALRGNTREILDKTRRVIFNLRSPEDEKFYLSSKFFSY